MPELKEFLKHAASWWPVVTGVVVTVGSGVGVYFYLEDLRRDTTDWIEQDAEWLEQDEIWNAEIIGRLVSVEEELATQTVQLEEQLATINRAWEQLQAEHRDLVQMIAAEAIEDAYRQGFQDATRARGP